MFWKSQFFAPYPTETGLNWFAIYTASSKKTITYCQVYSSRLGLHTKKRGYICTSGLHHTLEKLEVLVTSMVCILDVQPYFLDTLYARTSLNGCPVGLTCFAQLSCMFCLWYILGNVLGHLQWHICIEKEIYDLGHIFQSFNLSIYVFSRAL